MSDKNINKYKELCKQENIWFTKEEGEAFSKGYELAQKEIQEKIDKAIEVMKMFHFKAYERSRDLLKARGDK